MKVNDSAIVQKSLASYAFVQKSSNTGDSVKALHGIQYT